MATDDQRKVVHVETDLDKKVFETMAEWHRMKEDNERLQASNEQWEASYTRVEQENAMLRARAIDLEQKLGYYMRHSTELATRLVDIDRVIQMALNDARMAGYRPPPAGQPRSQPAPQPAQPAPQQLQAPRPGEGPHDDGQPIPRFLKDNRAPTIEEDIAARTRDITQLRRGEGGQ